MALNRRKYKRFSATAFINIPVHLTPLPPYFGRGIKGKLIDLSAGGMAIVIKDLIPQGTTLQVVVGFPDGTKIESRVEVRRVVSKNRSFLHGIEFLNLPVEWVNRIEKMSSDYIDCEARIQSGEAVVCRQECAFFTMCSKPQRLNPLLDPSIVLDISFSTVEPTTITA